MKYIITVCLGCDVDHVQEIVPHESLEGTALVRYMSEQLKRIAHRFPRMQRMLVDVPTDSSMHRFTYVHEGRSLRVCDSEVFSF